jgi:hypothetical protein
VQHPILRQQYRPPIQQFVENLNVGNPRMLSCQKYEHDLPLAQAVAELRHEFGIRADAFVNNNPFDVVHDKGPPAVKAPTLYRGLAPMETGPFAWKHPKNGRFRGKPVEAGGDGRIVGIKPSFADAPAIISRENCRFIWEPAGAY